MREDFYDLAKYAVKKGVRVSMTPSATPLVRKMQSKKLKILDYLVGHLVLMDQMQKFMITFVGQVVHLN